MRAFQGEWALLSICINDLWREARTLLSLGIHAFNGIRCNLVALREHQAGPKTVCLYVMFQSTNKTCIFRGG
jgi:hypothetical protein